MKVLYQCEGCGQLYDNPNEAILCEKNGPRPKFKAGEKAYLASCKGEYLEPVTIKEIIITSALPISYMIAFEDSPEDWYLCSEKSLQKKPDQKG